MKKKYIDQNNHCLPYKVRIKPLLATLCLFFLLITTAQATIWRVNSNREVLGANFYSLADAQSAASAGDTLHLEASLFGYGSLTLTKSLTLIGPGYFLIENRADTTRADSLNAQLNNLTINSGAKGAVVMGLEIVGNTIIRGADSVAILRNKLRQVIMENCENTFIRQNYIHASSTRALELGGTCRNTHILNNIIIAGNLAWNSILIRSVNSVLTYIQNNVLYGINSVHNAYVNNNILRSGSFSNNLDYPNSFYNNMSDQSDFGTTNGNLANVIMSTVFTQSSQSPDKYYELKPDSPARGAGKDGKDMGPFGGDDPYRLSGIVPLPSIFEVEITETGSPASRLDVTFKAKANN